MTSAERAGTTGLASGVGVGLLLVLAAGSGSLLRAIGDRRPGSTA